MADDQPLPPQEAEPTTPDPATRTESPDTGHDPVPDFWDTDPGSFATMEKGSKNVSGKVMRQVAEPSGVSTRS